MPKSNSLFLSLLVTCQINSGRTGQNNLKRAQIKAEYHQLLEMAPAFGVRLLGTALVVISGFYRFPWQRTRVGFLSDHCRRIKVDYQSGSKRYRWQTPRSYFPPRRGDGN